MNLKTTVDTIHDDIRSIAKFVKGTWQSSAEVTKDRITEKSLRDEWFYTNNYALDDIEDNDAFLYFGSKDDSIFRKDTIDEAFNQLINGKVNHYYKPSVEDVAKAKQSSLRFRISDLELKFDNEFDRRGYIEVDTFDLTGRNFKTDSQRKFAEAVYGSMSADETGKSDYIRAMGMLNDYCNGTKTARICVLRKETVLRDAKDGAVARACWLNNFDNNSYFVAFDRLVDSIDALRGVQIIGEANAQKSKNDAVKDAYKTILNNPLTDEIAKGLLKYATKHFSNK